MSLECFTCPECGSKLRTYDSKPFEDLGFSTVRRRKVCDCGFRATTVEIPIDLARDIFAEDEDVA